MSKRVYESTVIRTDVRRRTVDEMLEVLRNSSNILTVKIKGRDVGVFVYRSESESVIDIGRWEMSTKVSELDGCGYRISGEVLYFKGNGVNIKFPFSKKNFARALVHFTSSL